MRQSRHATKVLWMALGTSILLRPATACMQDRDSLEIEARGVPDVIQAISGRFARNPPLFFTMRLQRTVRELQADPSRLDLYDDAAVACDRISRSDEAIIWIEKKRAQLEKLNSKNPKVRDHWYRYWANIGTFRAHRWLRAGADRKHIGEMKQARDEIRRAIKINPGAHFGREKYQLKAMEWIVAPSKIPAKPALGEVPDFLGLHKQTYDYAPKNELERLGYGDAVRGLTGLIILGNAWESVDVYHALKNAMHIDHRSTLVYLSKLRLQELIRDGRHSLHPQAPTGPKLATLIASQEPSGYDPAGTPPKELDNIYRRLRDEADAWHARRTEYMTARLKQGRHPDWDSRFWDEWNDPGPPSLSESSFGQRAALPLQAGLIIVLSGALSVGLLRLAHRRTAR